MSSKLMQSGTLAACALLAFVVPACPAQTPQQAKAWVSCTSQPPGATILFGHPESPDNWEKGATPARVPVYDVGSEPRVLRVTLAKAGFEPYSTTISVRAGDDVAVSGKLLPRRMMSYVSDGKLVIANADGGSPVDVLELDGVTGTDAPAWLPDCGAVAIVVGRKLLRVSPDGKTATALADAADLPAPPGASGLPELVGPVVVASGRSVAFRARWGNAAAAAFLCPATGGGRAVPLGPDVVALAASPVEDVLALAGASGVRVVGVRGTGQVDPVTDLPGATEVAWSPDGTRVAVAMRGEVYTGKAGLTELAQLTGSEGAAPSDLLWAADGRHLFCRIRRDLGPRAKWDEIWRLCAPGEPGDPVLVVDGRTHQFSGELRPIGLVPYSTRLAYCVGTPPHHRTYATDWSRPGPQDALLNNSGLPSWSPPPPGRGSAPGPTNARSGGPR